MALSGQAPEDALELSARVHPETLPFRMWQAVEREGNPPGGEAGDGDFRLVVREEEDRRVVTVFVLSH